VVVLSALSAVSCSGSPPARSVSSPLRSVAPHAGSSSRPPSIAPTTHRPSTTSATRSSEPSGALNGKFSVTGIWFPTPTTGYVDVGGYPGDGNGLYAWIEHTTDGGRTWAPLAEGEGDAAPASGAHIAWVNARDGWSSVVSYATHSPVATLYFTTDAGRTWQVEREPFWIADIAVSHGSSWLATTSLRCAHICPETIYTANRVGGPLTRLPAQPSTTKEISALVRLSPDTAVAMLHGRDTSRFVSTTDAGRTWGSRALPCSAHQFDVAVTAGPDGTLYLTCTAPSRNMCASCGLVRMFESDDLGASWTRSPARGAGRYLCCVADLTPTSAREVWLLQTNPVGSGALLRSTDHAHTFTRVLNGYLGPLAAYRDTAWVIADEPTRGGHVFVVHHTDDGGKTWQTSPLPTPPDIPTR
jgi:photosystem II stability/assembly factor-like uncharacterized protein